MAPPSPPVGDKLHAGSGWRALQCRGKQGGAPCRAVVLATHSHLCLKHPDEEAEARLSCRNGREGAGLCLHPGVHPCPWPLNSSHGAQVGGTHSTFSEKSKGQDGWRVGRSVM